MAAAELCTAGIALPPLLEVAQTAQPTQPPRAQCSGFLGLHHVAHPPVGLGEVAATPGGGGGFLVVFVLFFVLGADGTAPAPTPADVGIGTPGFHPGHPGRGSVGPEQASTPEGALPVAALPLGLAVASDGFEPPDLLLMLLLLLLLREVVVVVVEPAAAVLDEVDLVLLAPGALPPPTPVAAAGAPGWHMAHALHWQRAQWAFLEDALQNALHCSILESPASVVLHLAGGGSGAGGPGGFGQKLQLRHWQRLQ